MGSRSKSGHLGDVLTLTSKTRRRLPVGLPALAADTWAHAASARASGPAQGWRHAAGSQFLQSGPGTRRGPLLHLPPPPATLTVPCSLSLFRLLLRGRLLGRRAQVGPREHVKFGSKHYGMRGTRPPGPGEALCSPNVLTGSFFPKQCNHRIPRKHGDMDTEVSGNKLTETLKGQAEQGRWPQQGSDQVRECSESDRDLSRSFLTEKMLISNP